MRLAYGDPLETALHQTLTSKKLLGSSLSNRYKL